MFLDLGDSRCRCNGTVKGGAAELAIGRPHFKHAGAASLISVPQSGHLMSAMFPSCLLLVPAPAGA
jgi:hypothetical protein